MGEIELRKLELLPGGFVRESIRIFVVEGYGELDENAVGSRLHGSCAC